MADVHTACHQALCRATLSSWHSLAKHVFRTKVLKQSSLHTHCVEVAWEGGLSRKTAYIHTHTLSLHSRVPCGFGRHPIMSCCFLCDRKPVFPFLCERAGGVCCRDWRVCQLSTYFLTCMYQVHSVGVGIDRCWDRSGSLLLRPGLVTGQRRGVCPALLGVADPLHVLNGARMQDVTKEEENGGLLFSGTPERSFLLEIIKYLLSLLIFLTRNVPMDTVRTNL